MTHEEKISWMAVWAARHGLQLVLEGECGFGRDCVGISVDGHYPDYHWHNQETWEREDENGDIFKPADAYHKHDCVAVLGRGENAEAQLYDWLKWFDDNGFVCETGDQPMDPALSVIGIMFNKHRYARMVRKVPQETETGTQSASEAAA